MNIKNDSVLICGTSPAIEIFEDQNLVNIVQEKFSIFCANTSYYYFDNIDGLFVNGKFTSLSDEQLSAKKIGTIFSSVPMNQIKNIHKKMYIIDWEWSLDISIDIDKPLVHGPTTMLDIVFPCCGYYGVKNIYIIGAEYANFKRFSKDSSILPRSEHNWPIGSKEKELNLAHQKLKVWHEYFKSNNIKCFALSEDSETPFDKIKLGDIL